MVQEGSCTLSTDEAGYVLDRLAGMQQVISDEAIRQALADTGRVQKRSCRLTLEVTLWIVLAMGVLTDLPIRQVFKQARRMRCGEKSSDRSSLCVARQRLGVAPVRALFESTVHPLARPDTIGGFYKGLRLVGIDGAYHERWEEELTYDEQKTHQDPRRATKPAHLRSQTPAGVIQELYALSLAHFVIRALMFEAAESVHLDPERLSFTGCFQILKCRLPECVTHNTGNVSDMVRQPALGDAAGASPTASQSHQPASHQTEDQKVDKEAAPPATSTKTQQNIRRFSPYSLIQRYWG